MDSGSDHVYLLFHAEVAESVDAHDSKSCSFGSVGSSPTFGTTHQETIRLIQIDNIPEGVRCAREGSLGFITNGRTS
jgi:hypothetical protein